MISNISYNNSVAFIFFSPFPRIIILEVSRIDQYFYSSRKRINESTVIPNGNAEVGWEGQIYRTGVKYGTCVRLRKPSLSSLLSISLSLVKKQQIAFLTVNTAKILAKDAVRFLIRPNFFRISFYILILQIAKPILISLLISHRLSYFRIVFFFLRLYLLLHIFFNKKFSSIIIRQIISWSSISILDHQFNFYCF